MLFQTLFYLVVALLSLYFIWKQRTQKQTPLKKVYSKQQVLENCPNNPEPPSDFIPVKNFLRNYQRRAPKPKDPSSRVKPLSKEVPEAEKENCVSLASLFLNEKESLGFEVRKSLMDAVVELNTRKPLASLTKSLNPSVPDFVPALNPDAPDFNPF